MQLILYFVITYIEYLLQYLLRFSDFCNDKDNKNSDLDFIETDFMETDFIGNCNAWKPSWMLNHISFKTIKNYTGFYQVFIVLYMDWIREYAEVHLEPCQ